MSSDILQKGVTQQSAFIHCINSHSIENTPTSSKPVIETLSLRAGAKIDVRGSTSARKGQVETFAENRWRGIASVNPDGTFHNADVPANYLNDKDAVLVRVVDGEASIPVLANSYFVHSRSIWVTPTPTKQADQQAYRWNLQWADYKPTGYKLPANTSASLYLEGDDSNVTATIGIQGLAQQLDRRQQTPNMREYRLKQGENPLPHDALGGVIHIRNNGSAGCRVIFDQAFQPIPYYHLHHTQPVDFLEMLKRSDALSEVQLVGDRVAISAYADTYQLFAHADVGEIVRSHEEVLRIQVQACGLDGSSPRHARSDMWIHAVEAASPLNPHATTGYIGLPHGSNPGNEYMHALLAGEAHKRWVTLHEYGHHLQNRVNAIGPMFGENSVNIYALAVGRIHKNEYSEVFPTRWLALKAWLAKPREQKAYMESPDTQAIFEQLRKGFGNHFLPAWDRHVRDNPQLSTDLIGFATSLAKVANCNLADFLADWGVIKVNDATWQALQNLHLPVPPAGLTAQVPYL